MATTLFPTIAVITVSLYLALVMVVLAATAVVGLRWLARYPGRDAATITCPAGRAVWSSRCDRGCDLR